jgi:CRP/FNR family transcriptional regulator, cyclic AMP receptor protein
LVVDPDLASSIQGSARRKAALRAVVATPLELSSGERFDHDRLGAGETLGIVVLGGFLVREWTTAGHTSADLLGPDDVIHPSSGEAMITMLRHTVSWTAITPTRLALLDQEFFNRAARWPEIAGCLLQRSGRLGQRLALRGAIETLSVDARLLASFWLWASQWATVAGQGVVLRLPLSHERIARLIHARRPTVTTALGRLRQARLLSQREDGAWLLRAPAGDNGAPSENGLVMPVLGELLERGLNPRTKPEPVSSADARQTALHELKDRLAEQRATLEIAAKRHREMLERMREETGRLANTAETINRREQ